jgi:SAM-dependent methyltransferase
MSGEDRSKLEEQIRACYASWANSYFQDYYDNPHSYPPTHAEVVKEILLANQTKVILDAGCGPGSFLRYIADTEMEWHGFDLVPEMTAEAARVAQQQGRGNSEVWIGSVLRDESFSSPRSVKFDGAVMIGVLPHIPIEEDQKVLKRLRDAVVPGGTLIAEARNALFGLFTLNRPTFHLLTETFMNFQTVRKTSEEETLRILDEIEKDLSSRLAMNLPPKRTSSGNGPGYDDVLARMHVPFELQKSAQQAGWDEVEIHYAHFHALPPMYEGRFPDVFRKLSLDREDSRDWRGIVMASTVLVSGKRPFETGI